MTAEFHIIPSVRREKDFAEAMNALSRYVLLSGQDIDTLAHWTMEAHKANKIVLANPGLIGGLDPSPIGLKLLKTHFGVDGILSPNLQQLRVAQKEGLFCIQRIFLFDSQSWDTGLKALAESTVDAVEILPGTMAPKFASALKRKGVAMLAGGFIKTRKQVKELYAMGFMGATTTAKDLWRYDVTLEVSD